MKSNQEVVAIGEAAQRHGLATHVLRHWESVGLLTPERRAGQRRYGEAEFHRIVTILRAKEAGLGLDRIAAMINTKDAHRRREILRRHRERLQQSIMAAERAVQMIDCAEQCEHDDFTRCPHYRRAIADGLPG